MPLYIPIPVYVTLSSLALAACIANILNIPEITFHQAVKELLGSHLNLAVVINTIFTLLILFGKIVQYIFFGQLRDIEARNFSDRLWTYVISKLIFIFAAKEPELGSLLVWGFWFSILCCLKLFSLLSRDRFEYLNTFLPNTHAKIHLKLLLLLVLILFSDLLWFYFSIAVFYNDGLSNLMLLNFECFTIFFETIQTLIKYAIHLFDMSSDTVWDKRGQYIYYTEFSTDSIILAGTCAHLIHIVIIQGPTPTLLHIVLLCYFKLVFTNLRRKIESYQNYCKLTDDMDNKYPNVFEDDLKLYSDDCAICRDRMESAKKLPCGHIFHHSCLRAWLEQHHSCPTCRTSLIDPFTEQSRSRSNSTNQININNQQNSNTTQPNNINNPSSNSSNNLSNQINFIHNIYPNISIERIQSDLLITNSVDRTIDNILAGNLIESPSIENNQNSSINSNNNICTNSTTTTTTTTILSTSLNNHNNDESSSSPSPLSSLPSTISNNSSSSTSPGTSKYTSYTGANRNIDETKKSSSRFSTLQERKQAMLEESRRRYLEKLDSELGITTSSNNKKDS